MKLLYISISGNTRSFVKRLAIYAEDAHKSNQSLPLFELKEISENSQFEVEDEKFVTFVPTYLEGGNGVDNGDTEILTEVMREYLDYEDNYKNCLGVIGSGNKNFNYQYCLTAKQYSETFNFPLLADFELRGNSADLERIYNVLKKLAVN
ncbi:class Ib ribonucleoside-diphosphate reductase assembly flavoprotein NrdI [Enterococcus sp. AZ109]|uniref:class Ib ribonucleoside-diphosphate reductase assembly flavoprotein NrdI n=1 Tax=Enterococcus sp. AZ109 TaxID=2774634 RepID=UPI003F227530